MEVDVVEERLRVEFTLCRRRHSIHPVREPDVRAVATPCQRPDGEAVRCEQHRAGGAVHAYERKATAEAPPWITLGAERVVHPLRVGRGAVEQRAPEDERHARLRGVPGHTATVELQFESWSSEHDFVIEVVADEFGVVRGERIDPAGERGGPQREPPAARRAGGI